LYTLEISAEAIADLRGLDSAIRARVHCLLFAQHLYESILILSHILNISTIFMKADFQRPDEPRFKVKSPYPVIKKEPPLAGSFNFKIFHFMRLTASIGFAAKSWSASVIFVCPVNRKTESAVFRMAAIT